MLPMPGKAKTVFSIENQQGRAVGAVAAWTAAGIPVSKIVLGVASYGHAFTLPPFSGPASGDPAGADVCGNYQQVGDTWNFWSLVDAGILLENGTATPGVPYRFDDCSKTDYVYNKTTGAMMSYDGPSAFAAKGEFIKNMGLRVFAIWKAAGDFNDIPLDTIREAAGSDDCDE
ncbi:hypothetical protein ACEPAF_7134 [Sanghuangporus sanghuang]|uniref:Chitinase n=1 Tax=Sanghuangporus baumii TaxID=108892 RepID=A0A9Q5I5F2_SANBA|nr:chitinase [Sanghuangporus baumii]